jgi:GcrA cell cycle regulator
MSWTDERVETLKKMWAEGQSASQIAKELGGVTRNAVIGKVHRLGLSNRAGAGPVPGSVSGPASGAPSGTAPGATAAAVDPAPKPGHVDRPIRARSPADDDDDDLDPVLDDASEAETDDLPDAEEDDLADDMPVSPARRAIIPAGQPLPPQPSANEISPEALAKVTEVEKSARKLTLMELTEKTCKWPVGDPATDNFWFCGLPVQPGKPYCEAHVGVAFQPMSARRDRRR